MLAQAGIIIKDLQKGFPSKFAIEENMTNWLIYFSSSAPLAKDLEWCNVEPSELSM